MLARPGNEVDKPNTVAGNMLLSFSANQQLIAWNVGFSILAKAIYSIGSELRGAPSLLGSKESDWRGRRVIFDNSNERLGIFRTWPTA